jgi:uncharacterized protein (DUF488 family)
MSGTLYTIGHSTRTWQEFVGLLHENAIGCLVDVRRFAGSRRNPQYSPAEMAPALEAAAITYRPMPEFGGRRKPDGDTRNGAWRVEAFRGYADYMATPEFALARERLMRQALDDRTCVMCAEAVWWRCHRRLIADDFIARGWNVLHIMGPGKLQAHELNPAAILDGDTLIYPPPQEKLF